MTRRQTNPCYPELNSFLDNIRTQFDQNGTTIYKVRNEVKNIQYKDFILNVKSFKVPHLLNRFVYSYIRKSKARRSYEYAMTLERKGVATPAPVGYIENTHNGLLQDSYYISLCYPYDFTIREVLEGRVDNKDEILESFARYCWNVLHRNGVFHLDFSPGNILIRKINSDYEFSLIDLNRMKFCKIDPIIGLKNLRQLHTTVENMQIIARAFGSEAGLDPEWCAEKLIAMDRSYQNYRSRRQAFKKGIKKLNPISAFRKHF
ncbi:MAG: lipopolysaccharide kinase InaA family protein [Bacteroidota bacterium]|nr:lipopolysaccharide kinase InaA family protein [Bacteroidota bacterium]